MLEGLNRARRFPARRGGTRVGLRHAPELEFVYDQQIEHADTLTRCIDGAVKSDQHDEPDTRLGCRRSRRHHPARQAPGADVERALQRVRTRLRSAQARATRHPRSDGHRHVAGVPGRGHQGHRPRSNPAPSATSSPSQLGARTDTGDAEGQVVDAGRGAGARRGGGASGAGRAFVASIQQVPPMYSALKRDGRPLYRLARARASKSSARPRTHRDPAPGTAGTRRGRARPGLRCAKGTYVRALGEDIARELGTCGHLTRLRRTWVEPFTRHADGHPRGRVGGSADGSGLLAADVALRHLPRGRVPEQARPCALRHGQAVTSRPSSGVPVGRRVRLYGAGGAFPGPRRRCCAEGRLQPRRLIGSGVP